MPNLILPSKRALSKPRSLWTKWGTVPYYQPATKTWRGFAAKHNTKKNTFAITISDFDTINSLFVIGKK